MREILFKGKRIVNGEWVEGDLAQYRDLKTMYIQGFDYYTGEGGWEREPFCYQIDPETLSQYTELDGMNGNKIWENDIVRIQKDVLEKFYLDDINGKLKSLNLNIFFR